MNATCPAAEARMPMGNDTLRCNNGENVCVDGVSVIIIAHDDSCNLNMNVNIYKYKLPYSRRYWRELNLAVEPKIAIARI